MLILPDRHIPRSKILFSVHDHEWRTPSQAQPKDCFGRENHTRFRIRARLNDGHVKWCGWFDDRADFDAFLWAIATGSLHYERELWRLPSPWWDSDFTDLSYDFATVTFLTSPTGSNQTYTSPSDWNNSNNTVETVGSGASGGIVLSGITQHSTGGGAGAYSSISNFSFASPGTTTATYNIGTGAAAVSGSSNLNGNDGNVTWFNNASDPGAGTDNTKCSAKGGIKGVQGTGAQNGGLGGTNTSGWGQTRNSGGRGGNLTGTSGAGASGAGGGAGPAGAGGAGGDSAATTTNVVTAGGTANNGATAGGTTNLGTGNPGNSGTEWDGSHGVGSGGAGGSLSATGAIGGDGANYGGAGGAARSSTGSCTGGAGKQGIIVVTYTAAGVTFFGGQIFELPGRKSAVIGY